MKSNRSPTLESLLVAFVLTALTRFGDVLAQSPPAWQPASAMPQEPVQHLPCTVKEGFSIAIGGDLLGFYQPLTKIETPALATVSRLFQDATVGYANREGNVFDLRSFKGYPAAENGGFVATQMDVGDGPLATAAVASDMKRFGITMTSLANNHSTDWGLEGLAETEKNLDAAGVVNAGGGTTRAAARAAAYLETDKGRIALISTTSTYLPMEVAGPGSGERRARPGISALRNFPVTLVTPAEFSVLRAIASRQGLPVPANAREVSLNANEQTFNAQTFRVSDAGHLGLQYEVNTQDWTEILRAITDAKKRADFVVFAIHAHETATGGQEDSVAADLLQPADFLQPLFHAAINAGADLVVTTGPHVLRGIEIYQGKPIFYGMGSLFFQLGDLGIQLPQTWYDSVVAVSQYRGGQVSEVRLYPISLNPPAGQPLPRTLEGTPRLASPRAARHILETLQQASAQYGTTIAIRDGIGIIRPIT